MDAHWRGRTALLCLKELVAVMFILTAYNRLGAYSDLLTAPLLLFLTLVVFAFPFLNSYLFVFLRFGPWYAPGHLVRSAVQAALVCGAQMAGAGCAVALQRQVVAAWYSDAAMRNPEGGAIGALYADSVNLGAVESMMEEGCAVFVLLVGLLHCIEADAKGLVAYAFWNEEAAKPAVVAVDSEEVVQASNDMGSTGPPAVLPANKNGVKLRPLKPPLRASQQPATTTTPPRYNAVPVELILHASLVVAGVVRAFPSAHQSLHITVFVGAALVDGGFPDLFWARIGGGIVATGLALGYYHLLYKQAGRESVRMVNPLKRFVVDYISKPAVFMEAQLALPKHMKT
jgi:hypothetical protein